MDSLIFSLNAVAPIVLIIAVGVLLRKFGVTDGFWNVANKLVFKLFLPALLFYNVYNVSDFSAVNWAFILYAVVAVFVIFLVAMFVVPLFVKQSNRRGVVVQALFRSNYAIIGVPLATNLYGASGAAASSLLSAFVIPLFNVLAVIALTFFNDDSSVKAADGTSRLGGSLLGGSLPSDGSSCSVLPSDGSASPAAANCSPSSDISPCTATGTSCVTDCSPCTADDSSADGSSAAQQTSAPSSGGFASSFAKSPFATSLLRVLKGIVTNPLIIAVCCGLVALGIRQILQSCGSNFRLFSFEVCSVRVTLVGDVIKSLANVATPLALLVLGGKFRFERGGQDSRIVTVVTAIRMVVIPAVALTVAYFLLPSLSGEHFAAYLAVFGSPVAVASAVMAKEMGGDDDLAGKLVVWNTVASAVTLFLFIAALRALSVL